MRRILVSIGAGMLLATVVFTSAWWLLRVLTSAPESRPGLTLLVNMRAHIEMTPGTPLVFELSLGSSPLSPRFDVGSRWRPWHALVRIEDAVGGGSVTWPMMRVGPPRSIRMFLDTASGASVTESTSAVAHLDAGRYVHTVTLAAGPDETAEIEPGTHRLRAVLETPFWMIWGWRGRVESGVATIVVVDPSRGGEKSQELESQRLARSADFYVNAGRFADAHRLATTLTSLSPNESRSFILLGDAAAGLDRRQEALDAYQQALALRRPSYEEPTVLYERIESVLRRR